MRKFIFLHLISKTISCLTLMLFSALIVADENPTEKVASIIIDDLGNNLKYGRDIIEIPEALTIAVLPKTHFSKRIAQLAEDNNKEVMLHLPMESEYNHLNSPDTLSLHMTKEVFKKQLALDLDSIPYARGVNNHMGSLLTKHPEHMTWLMDELVQRGNLYFVDSKTTNESIADEIAGEHNIPSFSRDFFLDPNQEEATLRRQFVRFINKVNKRGYALAIAHPYPKTIEFLKQNLHRLEQQGIRLVPVSSLLEVAAAIDNTQLTEDITTKNVTTLASKNKITKNAISN